MGLTLSCETQDPYFSKKPPPKAQSVVSDNGVEGWEGSGGAVESSHHVFDRPSDRGDRETSSGDRGEARRSSEMDTSEEVITCQVRRYRYPPTFTGPATGVHTRCTAQCEGRWPFPLRVAHCLVAGSSLCTPLLMLTSRVHRAMLASAGCRWALSAAKTITSDSVAKFETASSSSA